MGVCVQGSGRRRTLAQGVGQHCQVDAAIQYCEQTLLGTFPYKIMNAEVTRQWKWRQLLQELEQVLGPANYNEADLVQKAHDTWLLAATTCAEFSIFYGVKSTGINGVALQSYLTERNKTFSPWGVTALMHAAAQTLLTLGLARSMLRITLC